MPTVPSNPSPRRASVRYSTGIHGIFLIDPGDHQVTPPIPIPHTLEDHIQQLPPLKKCAIDHIHVPDNGQHITAQISNRTCIAVSDGSYKDGIGTSASIIVGSDPDFEINTVNTVPGPLKDGDSHRCELCGLIGIVLLTCVICNKYSIVQGAVTTLSLPFKYSNHGLSQIPTKNHLTWSIVCGP